MSSADPDTIVHCTEHLPLTTDLTDDLYEMWYPLLLPLWYKDTWGKSLPAFLDAAYILLLKTI